MKRRKRRQYQSRRQHQKRKQDGSEKAKKVAKSVGKKAYKVLEGFGRGYSW